MWQDRVALSLRVRQILSRNLCRFWIRIAIKPESSSLTWRRLGSDAHGKWVPLELLGHGITVVSGGIGFDASFDRALEELYEARIFACDPTPSVIAALGQGVIHEAPQKWTVMPVALASQDGRVLLFPQLNPKYTDWSLADIDRSGRGTYVDAIRVQSLMEEMCIDSIDLLKLDIEGAGVQVLIDCLKSRIFPKIICLEIEPSIFPDNVKYKRVIAEIETYGYKLGMNEGFEFTFVSKAHTDLVSNSSFN